MTTEATTGHDIDTERASKEMNRGNDIEAEPSDASQRLPITGTLATLQGNEPSQKPRTRHREPPVTEGMLPRNTANTGNQ